MSVICLKWTDKVPKLAAALDPVHEDPLVNIVSEVLVNCYANLIYANEKSPVP